MAKGTVASASVAWLALGVSVGALFAFGAYSLREPGLFYDEAFDAIPALEVLQSEPVECSASVRIGGRALPVMMHPHIGPTSIYVSLAAFALLGPSVASLRTSQLAVGAVALLLLFCLARAWFDDVTAALAVLLCGTAPSFVWWSRAGANWTVALLPFALGMLLALDRWWRSGSRGALVAAGLCCGLGITTKILFVWLALPMLLTGVVAIGPRRIVAAVRGTPLAVLLGIGAFLVGLAPLIAQNVPEPETFEHVFRNSVTTSWGHDNRAFLHNLRFITSRFLEMLDGDVLMAAPIATLGIGGAVVVLALLYGGARVAWPFGPRPGRRVRASDAIASRTFLVLAVVAVVVESTVTTSTLSATYLFLIVPLVWLLVAVLLGDLVALSRSPAARGPARALALVGALALALSLVGSHLWTNERLVRFFDQTGGRAQWSDAIYRVTDVLERDFPDRPIVALDWGLAKSVELLTARRLRVVEGHEFLPAPSDRFAARVRELLTVPGSVFLVHDDSFATCRGCSAVLEQVARAEGRELSLAREVRDGEGRVHTRIYELEVVQRLAAHASRGPSELAPTAR